MQEQGAHSSAAQIRSTNLFAVTSESADRDQKEGANISHTDLSSLPLCSSQFNFNYIEPNIHLRVLYIVK